MHMCRFDLQKAFNSVEFPVLHARLAILHFGINGKTWRLIRSWYAGRTCFVHVDGASSTSFPIERGVRQGTILSPIPSNVIMDPLLSTLESSGLELSVNNLYVAHTCMPMISEPLLPPCHLFRHRSHKCLTSLLTTFFN